MMGDGRAHKRMLGKQSTARSYATLAGRTNGGPIREHGRATTWSCGDARHAHASRWRHSRAPRAPMEPRRNAAARAPLERSRRRSRATSSRKRRWGVARAPLFPRSHPEPKSTHRGTRATRARARIRRRAPERLPRRPVAGCGGRRSASSAERHRATATNSVLLKAERSKSMSEKQSDSNHTRPKPLLRPLPTGDPASCPALHPNPSTDNQACECWRAERVCALT